MATRRPNRPRSDKGPRPVRPARASKARGAAAAPGARRSPASGASGGGPEASPAARAAKAPASGAKPRRLRETQDARLERALRLVAALARAYPGATTELEHRSALELLVATILAAQATDATVNRVMPVLLARYPHARALAEAPIGDLEEILHPTGFFRDKAKRVRGACARLVEAYGGEVPGTMDDLLTLPGVARKTANVVLGTWFGKNEGIIVDTHVGRVATRLGLTWRSRGEKDAVRIEEDLMQLVPRDSWTSFAHAMTLHGRRVCTARAPKCGECGIAADCPSAGRA